MLPCVSFLSSGVPVAALQLAVEAIFLEVVLWVTVPGSSGLSERQTDALQDLAFDWILAADRYVEPRYHELAWAREKACPPPLVHGYSPIV